MSVQIEPRMASIIIPCWNQLSFTRLCVASLFRHTRRPWELIAIDNGSTDGTSTYLAGIQDAAPVPVTIISNARNVGFPAACNQGLKVARGDYLVLLNNDVVVTEAWLNQLVALAEITTDGTSTTEHTGSAEQETEGGRKRREVIGLVGPMSNYAAPPQLVGNVTYADMDQMQVFASRWRDEHRGQWFTAGKLSGFCLLMKRSVYEAIGGLDERFGLGFFDDDDLAERARHAGFELAVAHDLFIHHFGSRTFAGAGINADRLLQENSHRFAEKWGTTNGRGQEVRLTPWTGDDSRVTPGRDLRDCVKAKVSLTVIARDEENNLPHCLSSVRGLFDEIVLVDTGSKDRTREIAQEFGARVFDLVWVDDFAAARNAALARATGDFAFWLDADDVIDPPQRERLERLMAGLLAGEQAAYVVKCSCDPEANGNGGQTVVDHIRLFPIREDVRWTYRVHEQILPALRRANLPVRWTDITVRHTGYTDPVLREKKLQRDGKILEEELAERPSDPFVLFNLGSVAVERQDWPKALDYLRRSLSGSASTDSITRKLFALIARCHQMLGDLPGALAVCSEGLSFDPDDAELLFRKAVVHRTSGQPSEAESCWRRILTLKRPEQFCSVDQGIYGHLTLRNLAALAQERGDSAEAQRLWRAILAECPGDPEAMAKLQG
jgi:glycosyltransferase involved in cell wall biosynthesis